MSTRVTVRPVWTPITTALMIIGFIAFWPLGLVMLAYILWGQNFIRELRRGVDSVVGSLYSWPAVDSGNRAFNDWRTSEEMRLKQALCGLDETRQAFDTWDEAQRLDHDRNAFDRFMADRRKTRIKAPHEKAA